MFIADSHCDTLSGLRHGRDISSLMINRDKMQAGGLCMQTFALFTGSKGTLGTPYQDGIVMLSKRDELGIPIFNAMLPDTPPEYPCGVISIEG